MDQKAIQTDIKNYKIREGPLYKRSKFLKEWRERWIVLTTNFLYTFTNKNCDEMTDAVDLKQIKSYKSYLRKDQQMIPPGFKIRSADDMMYFCAKNCNQKWSWIVTFQRLMDYKYVGSSNYNNADWIKTKGFDAQVQFQSENAKKPQDKNKQVASPQKKAQQNTPAIEKKASQNQNNEQKQKLLKQIDQQRKQLEKKKFQIELKQATVTTQLKKIEQQWAKIQEAKKQLQTWENQQKSKHEEQHKQIKVEKTVQDSQEKKQDERQSIKPSQNIDSPQRASFAQLKSMFDKKPEASQNPVPKLVVSQKKPTDKKQQDITSIRSRVITLLFQQYRQNTFTNSLKYVTDFIISVGGDSNSGFASQVVIQGKANPHNKKFAEVFSQFLSQYQIYQKSQNLMKFLYICFFQMPFIFTPEQRNKASKKLIKFLNNVKNEQILGLVLKNMLIMNKTNKYLKSDVGQRLQSIISGSKNDELISFARRLKDDL